MMNIKDFIKLALSKCLSDYFAFLRIVEAVYPNPPPGQPIPEWAYLSILNIVEEMLKSRLFVIGFLEPDRGDKEFIPLMMSIDETMDFIKGEWKNSSGQQPHDIGFLLWFQASEEGKKMADELWPK